MTSPIHPSSLGSRGWAICPVQAVTLAFPGQNALDKTEWKEVPAKLQKGRPTERRNAQIMAAYILCVLAHGYMWDASLCGCMGVCEVGTHPGWPLRKGQGWHRNMGWERLISAVCPLPLGRLGLSGVPGSFLVLPLTRRCDLGPDP